jgi:hypothetical protein
MTISITIYILAFVLTGLLIWVTILEHRLRKFFAGSKGHNLEDTMAQIMKHLKDVKETQIHINEHLLAVDGRLAKSIRNIQTVRFNPFDDAGSNQSFAMSFLNDEGDGVVISSLYARDRMSIFAKPIVRGSSEFELSVEEKAVVEKAK